jgi:hypothetical protein
MRINWLRGSRVRYVCVPKVQRFRHTRTSTMGRRASKKIKYHGHRIATVFKGTLPTMFMQIRSTHIKRRILSQFEWNELHCELLHCLSCAYNSESHSLAHCHISCRIVVITRRNWANKIKYHRQMVVNTHTSCGLPAVSCLLNYLA